MKLKVYGKCQYFTQHYIYSKKIGFTGIQCGHCKKNLMKKKDCECFEERLENIDKEISIMQRIHLYHRNMDELSYKLGNLIHSINNLTIEVKNLFK